MISSELILSWVEKEVRVITFDFFLPKQNDNFVATDHYMYFYPFPNFKAGSWNTFMPNVGKEHITDDFRFIYYLGNEYVGPFSIEYVEIILSQNFLNSKYLYVLYQNSNCKHTVFASSSNGQKKYCSKIVSHIWNVIITFMIYFNAWCNSLIFIYFLIQRSWARFYLCNKFESMLQKVAKKDKNL